jgi:site-specific recombinase XerD
MSPFYTEGDLEGSPVSFSPNVRRMRCSQVGRDVLRQDAAVRRYAHRVIRTTHAQQSTRFPGMARGVLAHLQLRHSAATTLLELGVPLEHIQKFLGHAKLETTQIYAASAPEMIKEN